MVVLNCASQVQSKTFKMNVFIKSYTYYLLVVPLSNRFEEPLANLLNEQHRTVKEQLEQLRMKKSALKPPQEMEKSKPASEKPLQSLVLDPAQRRRLQQQMQQVRKHPQGQINQGLSAAHREGR